MIANFEFKTTGDISADGRAFSEFIHNVSLESHNNKLQELPLTEFCNQNSEQIRSELTQSLNTFFRGLETPEKYNEDLEVLKNLGKTPYPRQARLIVAACSYFANKQKSLILSSEMGTGKTLMSISIVATYLLKRNKFGNIAVLCPNHLKKKWEKEIKEIFVNHLDLIETHIIRTGEEFIRKTTKPANNKIRFFIFSKESAKLGYRLSDAYPVLLDKREDGDFSCKVCGSVFDSEKVNRDMKKYKNKCFTSAGIARKVSPYVSTRAKHPCCDKCCLQNNRDTLYPTFKDYLNSNSRKLDRESRRLSIAKAIKTKPKGFFEFFIADEMHELKGDTGQGQAFATISSHSKRIMGLTGTLLNGYASSLYYNLWRMFPRLMKKELELEFKSGLSHFIDKFGAYSYLKPTDTNEKDGTIVKKKSSTQVAKEIPEINPILIKLLLQNTLFLKLDEMNVPLPDYNEKVVTVMMDEEIKPAYGEYIDSLLTDIKEKRMKGLLGAFCNHSLSIPDAPSISKQYSYLSENDIEHHYYYEPEVTEDFITNKEDKLLELVTKELSEDRKVLVYSYYKESSDRVYRLLLRHFPQKNVALLSTNVASEKREEWISKTKADILIANPELVKTGLDLFEYPSIIFYETGMVTSTLEQASRRAWRIGQTKECRVFFLAFLDSVQMHALKLMSSKIRAVNNVRGRLLVSKNELSAISNNVSSLQEALVKSIEANEEINPDDIDSRWTFKPRELDVFEKHYEGYEPKNKVVSVIPSTQPQTLIPKVQLKVAEETKVKEVNLAKAIKDAMVSAMPMQMGLEPKVSEVKEIENSDNEVKEEGLRYHRNIPEGLEICFYQEGEFDPEEWELPYLSQSERDRLAKKEKAKETSKKAEAVAQSFEESKVVDSEDYDHDLYKRVVNKDGTTQLVFNW